MQAREAPDADDRPAHMRILVIDDDPLLLRTLQDILEADGHEVIAAPGGQAGIDAFNCCAGARRAVRSGVDRHGHALCRSGAMPLSRSSPTRMPTS